MTRIEAFFATEVDLAAHHQASPSRHRGRHTEASRIRCLSVGIGDRSFGLKLSATHEILKVPQITPVPGAPAPVLGVVPIRGSVVPVVDLGIGLGVARARSGSFRQARLVLVVADDEPVGLHVERILGVHDFLVEELDAQPPKARGIRRDWISGLGRRGEERVLLLDIDAMLSDLSPVSMV